MRQHSEQIEEGAVADRYLFGRRGLVALVLGVPISLVLLSRAARGTSVSQVTFAVSGAKLLPLCLALCAMSVVYLLQAERWRYIAKAYGTLPLRSSVAYVVGGVAINNVLPGRPGELVRAHWISRDLDIDWAKGFATVLVDRIFDVLALALLLAATYEAVPHPAWMRDLMAATVVVGGAMVIALLACRWYVARRGDRIRTWKGRVPAWLARQASLLIRGAASLLTMRRAVVVGGFSMGAWVVWTLAAYAVAQSLSMRFTLTEAMFVTAIVNLGVAIPSSPGFIGTYQWLCVEALGQFGVSADKAFAFSVLLHAVWFVPTTLAGVALLAVGATRRARDAPLRHLAAAYRRASD
jgi:glycosyltransferase 2 family protein